VRYPAIFRREPWAAIVGVMVYMSDATSAERERRAKRIGFFQLAAIAIGLPLLLLLFRPTPTSLAIVLALAVLGARNGFREARSGRLDMAMPPSPSSAPTSFSRFFPGLVMLGVVFGSLLSGQWVGAVAAIVFFFAGVAFGLVLANTIRPTR
jgi:hypothetical protein